MGGTRDLPQELPTTIRSAPANTDHTGATEDRGYFQCSNGAHLRAQPVYSAFELYQTFSKSRTGLGMESRS
jgi:hypothetical protein